MPVAIQNFSTGLTEMEPKVGLPSNFRCPNLPVFLLQPRRTVGDYKTCAVTGMMEPKIRLPSTLAVLAQEPFSITATII